MTVTWFQDGCDWILEFDHPLGWGKKWYVYETEARCIEAAHNILAWFMPMYEGEYEAL